MAAYRGVRMGGQLNKLYRLPEEVITRFGRFSKVSQKGEGRLVFFKCYEINSNKAIFIKYHRHANGMAQARAEFDALCTYFSASDQRWGVPRPVGVFSDSAGGGLVAAEWVNLPMAATWLKVAGVVPYIRDFVIHRSAEWLRWFHSVKWAQPISLKDAVDLDRIVEDIAQVIKHGEQLKCSGLRYFSRAVLVSAVRKHDVVLHQARLHGDFWQKNILLNPWQAIGVDLGNSVTGPVLLDISKFVSHLAVQSRVRTLANSRKCILADSAAFMETYSKGEYAGGNLALLLFNIRALLDLALDLAARIEHQPPNKKTRRYKEFRGAFLALRTLLNQLD